MTEQLKPLQSDTVLNVWIDVLETQLRQELQHAAPGHCVRVSELPRPILEGLASRFARTGPSTVEVYLIDRVSGPEPWRVGVHKLVERRNAQENIVLGLFPPDLQLAAGDSVDISTFRIIPVSELPEKVEATLRARIASGLQRQAMEVLEYLRVRGWHVTTSARLAYLALIAVQEKEDQSIAGAALYALGLVPDYALFVSPDEAHHRLGQRNIPLVQLLQKEGATVLERILRLPLSDETFRSRLITFFQGRQPAFVSEWGEEVATDPSWRDLSLDFWPLGEESRSPAEPLDLYIEPLKLPRREDDGLLLLEASSKITVAWQTSPPPIDVPRLKYFRIELVSSDRVVAWESSLIKITGGKTARRSRTIKSLLGLESGVYFFRVIALDEAGDPFVEQPLRDPQSGQEGKRTNETDDFLLLQPNDETADVSDYKPSINAIAAASYAEAEFLARMTAASGGKDPDAVHVRNVEWITPANAQSETASAAVRFDTQRQYSIRLSQRLRRLELEILQSPEAGGHYRLNVGPRASQPESLPIQLPPDLMHIRREVLQTIRQGLLDKEAAFISALADLSSLASKIERYARAFQAWLDQDHTEALRLDVTLVDLPEYGRAALLAPTHPLRLLWTLQKQQLARTWAQEAYQRKESTRALVEIWQKNLIPYALPALLVLGPEEGYIDAGPLLGGWQAYLPPKLNDSRAVLALLRTRLGSGAAHESEADIPPMLLADKLEMFLLQHPYTPALVLNVINPGDAALIVDTLIELERRRTPNSPSIRYLVRIFNDAPHREGIGDAFRTLVDPDRQISESAAKLVSPSQSFLFPKLAWSRNNLQEFLETPEKFPAHITLLLDAFPISLRVARIDPEERTSFVHGLIQEAPRRFAGRGRSYAWNRRSAPTPCPELAEAPGRSGLLAEVLKAIGTLQAQVLAPNTNTHGAVAVAALDLSPSGQSLLYSAHLVSTWVLTLDPHLGLDYFDAARQADQPGYLLDFTPEFLPSGGRQLLLTTRIDDEIAWMMKPATSQLPVDQNHQLAQLLMEALRSLSGRLALRLLSSPSQVQGALGMALSRLFLKASGLLSEALIIPLDAHPEFSAHEEHPFDPRMRGDLLVVLPDSEKRLLEFVLVETKCQAGTGLSADLRVIIANQLGSSEEALREKFDPTRHDLDRIDRMVQSWRLTSVLTFYLERAARYGLVQAATVDAFRKFFTSLDRGYSLAMKKIGLVFRLEALETTLDQSDPDLPIWVVGQDRIQSIIKAELEAFTKPQETVASEDQLSSEQEHDDAWEQVRITFGGTQRRRTDASTLQIESPLGASGPAHPIQQSNEDLIDEGAEKPRAETAVRASPDLDQLTLLPAEPNFDILLGETKTTPQFGLIGALSTEPRRLVAMDLNGCNTVSIFGVQGSGKSYTIGTILEMATTPIPGFNLLPKPLGAVVFHFNQTQDYPPEFISMAEPNNDPAQVQTLQAWGAQPKGLDDVLVLTTADTIELRKQEFPNVTVAPICFSSAELSVADWRFLMGATGNDALYLKLLNEVMRRARTALSLDAIRAGLQQAPLSDTQRILAETRLDFAARFIDDSRSLRSLLRPGRLIIVDLRDEFVEKEQALGLFVTMLNIFAGAGIEGEKFNKVIVFDEAHKYMHDSLSNQVVEVIREMRHKGVSVAIASQDPVQVPAAIIELSSAVILHRFNAPSWLKYLQKSLVALDGLTPSMFASLGPGEALIWANKATDPAFTRHPVKVRMRPRVTKHGGSTRTAIGEEIPQFVTPPASQSEEDI